MRSIIRRLLWVFAFTVPWEGVVAFPGVGTPSRVVGTATLVAALVTTVAKGRFRKPHVIFGFASAVIAFSTLSLLWTISYPDTIRLVWTSVQVLGSVWVVQEFAETREEQQSLLVAFCLGELVPLAGVLNTFMTGATMGSEHDRYTTTGFNADDLGLTLVIGIPIAWHLMMSYAGTFRPIVRAIALIYFVVAPVGILLSGTRGAMLAGVVALSIVPLTLPQRSLRSFFLITTLLVVVAGAAAVVVPERTWARALTIRAEVLEGGKMSGRTAIWEAGIAVFPERPLLGAGAGAYGAAVEPVMNTNRIGAHNLLLGLLVEQGIIGLSIYVALLGACAVAIVRMPPPERKLWAALMLSWLVGVSSLHWEYRKVTWLLFGLVAAQSAATRVRRRLSPSQRNLTETPFPRHSPRTVYSPAVDQRAIR
jgi:O-antigen ligase